MRGVDQVELAVGQALVEVPLGNLAASAIAGLLWTLASPRAAFAYLVAWMLLAWSAFCPPGAVGPDTYWCRPKPESTEVVWRSALFPQLGSPLAVAGRRMQKGHGLTSRNGPPTRTQEQPG